MVVTDDRILYAYNSVLVFSVAGYQAPEGAANSDQVNAENLNVDGGDTNHVETPPYPTVGLLDHYYHGKAESRKI